MIDCTHCGRFLDALHEESQPICCFHFEADGSYKTLTSTRICLAFRPDDVRAWADPNLPVEPVRMQP